MKTYYFTFISGHIGGSGVVRANNLKEGVELANIEIKISGINAHLIDEEDLIEVKPNQAIVITNGDY